MLRAAFLSLIPAALAQTWSIIAPNVGACGWAQPGLPQGLPRAPRA
jgi:hypothetical protein